MSNEFFVRQRRALNIMSVALIFYFTTGMEFSQQGLFLNTFAITIRHEVVAYVIIWIAFFYFWWRFHLYGKDVQQRWKMNFLYELSKNAKYRRLYSQPEGVGEYDPTVWAPSLQGEGFKRYLTWEEAYLVGVRTEDGQIQFAGRETCRDSINPVTQKWSVGPETVTPLKWRQYFFPALKANIAALKNKSGTEWALPNFLACIALICGVTSLVTIIR